MADDETTTPASADALAEAQRRLEQELDRYADCVDVHELPAIYHVWSHRYVLPKLLACGFDSVESFFLDPLLATCHNRADEVHTIASVGAGNCDLEVGLATRMRDHGVENFHFHCIELNPHMVERGKAMADEAGLSKQFTFAVQDVDAWEPKLLSAVIANHSLHHIVHLEMLFRKIRQALEPRDGLFLTNDMIGRNGHMRWPEAEALITPIWNEMPERYKFNHQLQRLEPAFVNWDCSVEGNEGIRAQDILPLLCEEFHFESFVAFGNLTDVFVDRSFGHNFDPEDEDDRDFVEGIARLDENKIDAGLIKPTHLLGAMRCQPGEPPRCYRHWTPEFCLRLPDTPYRQEESAVARESA